MGDDRVDAMRSERSVVITGAGRGIGRSIASSFASKGDHVAIVIASALGIKDGTLSTAVVDLSFVLGQVSYREHLQWIYPIRAASAYVNFLATLKRSPRCLILLRFKRHHMISFSARK